jgi:hypothetical protein
LFKIGNVVVPLFFSEQFIAVFMHFTLRAASEKKFHTKPSRKITPNAASTTAKAQLKQY